MPFKNMSHAGLLAAGILLLAAVAPAAAEPLRVVAFGDSLTAGYGLQPGEAFPDRLQAALRVGGHDVEIANAGVSGDTTSGGLARLDWSVPDGTALVILELGANDALRGVEPSIVSANLDAMLTRLKARGIPVLLAGMLAPPNMGPGYSEAFDPLYRKLAARHGVPLYPFFLDGVAAEKGLLLDDGMHPTAKGVDEIVRRILPAVERALAGDG